MTTLPRGQGKNNVLIVCFHQERKVFHSEGGLPQDVAERDPVSREHQQDRERGHLQLFLCQFLHLGLSGTGSTAPFLAFLSIFKHF
jgi:hypothetical protein